MFTYKNPNKVYNVRLINKQKGLDATIKVRGNEYIHDAAELQGVVLPASCRAGACITCTGKIIQGNVDQDHDFLKKKELDAGFVLTCKAYPLSDCVILTFQEDALLDL